MSLVKPVNTISNRMFSLARSANNTKFSVTERYPPPPQPRVRGWRRMTFQTTPTLNRNKFLSTGFFRALETKIDVDMADFTLGRKQWEILRHTSDNLNWFVGLALGTKFPPPPPPTKKNCSIPGMSWNGWMQLICKMESKVKIKEKCYLISLNYQD